MNEISVECIRFLGHVNPLFYFLKDLIFLKIEIVSEDFLKTSWRILYHVDDSVFNVAISYDVRVTLIFAFSLRSSLLMLITWFVEVYLIRHNNGLDREQDLEDSGNLRIPVFG